MEMRWEERAKRMVEVYCTNITNPLERVCLKEDLFCPLAKLPEIVGKMVSQNGNAPDFCLKYLSREELTEIEKDCTENLVLTKGILNPFYLGGRIDAELKKVISEKSSIWQRLNTWTKYRLLHVMANHIWQNIFDALLDNAEVRKLRFILLQDLFRDDKK
jgi:hypothetical protein